MFLKTPPDTDAGLALYSRDVADDGYVMNLTRLWAWRPEVYDAFARARTILAEKSGLSLRERAVLVCAMIPATDHILHLDDQINRIIERRITTPLPVIVEGVSMLQLMRRINRVADFAIYVTNSRRSSGAAMRHFWDAAVALDDKAR